LCISSIRNTLAQIPYQMKFALIRERKNPPDRRVVLTPDACAQLLKTFPEMEILAESSPNRTFTDEEYRAKGIEVSEEISAADVMLGVKEVPVEALIPNKKYFFFSHTIKKQPYNRKLLRAILEKNIELYDHEVITDPKEIRLVAFGRYAGIVGAYNGIRAFGLKTGEFDMPKAETLHDQKELIEELKKVDLPGIRIVLTGKGRVSNGAKEMLDGMVIHGTSRLRGAEVDSHRDHRLAMALAVAGLVADGDTVIYNAEAADISYPGFWSDLQQIVSSTHSQEEEE